MAAINLTTEIVGRRIYIVGNSFPIKKQLSDLGCTFDRDDRKQWWIGTGKRAELEALLASLNGSEVKEDVSTVPLIAKVKYKGRSYYALRETKDGLKVQLTVLDASIVFWAEKALCELEKEYKPFEIVRRGRVVDTLYTTLASIRDYIADQKREDARDAAGQSETKQCWECGRDFTHRECKQGGGDWAEGYCGC